ncbi:MULTISPECIES: element excision factor XisI family protein, partial [unclassified Microcoleus]|uniref:element excision factor XisI family protein n=1 Tax=unclassified Microcoleus TaxID=2642155 RepID=UPI002FD11AB2
MANVDLYRQHIQNLLSQHASLVWDERIQAQTIFDTERDHYQLVYVGWRNHRRIYGPVLHLDIMDNKIWIQQDGTGSIPILQIYKSMIRCAAFGENRHL